ncbi:MAG: NAD-dependent epimerase/dehydratase family protein [Herpetosiphonaceae bacterium]|nr:NAD-dependent epimerase/dehydratase family protein [Herpetosiphonaceae bacterium]
MKILILGGTQFLGVHLVEAALQRGHTVTIFNRGQTRPELFPPVEHLQGDRDGDLRALEGRRWDAVIDTSGYVPRIVKASAQLLAAADEHYTFISTINVYADPTVIGLDEQSPLATLADETVEEVNGTTYGPLKVLCEQAVQAAFPNRALIIRPGLIVGPRDATCRFTYWPHRLAQGGDVLAPDHQDQPVQIIDVRDLAAWTIQMVEARQVGVYTATGPDDALTFGQLIQQCQAVSGHHDRIVWVGEAFLQEKGVAPWVELPLWIPSGDGPAGLLSVNNHKAIQSGLAFRPLIQTIQDTLAWDAAHPEELAKSGGLKPEREQELLQEWAVRSKEEH